MTDSQSLLYIETVQLHHVTTSVQIYEQKILVLVSEIFCTLCKYSVGKWR